MSLGVLCGGQGRHDRQLFDRLADQPAAQPVLAALAEHLGAEPVTFCRQATPERLHANPVSQLLCVGHALALGAVLFPAGLPSDSVVAGYSVGEMAAWGLAGVWSPAATLALIAKRAALMDQASGPDDRLGYLRGLALTVVERLAAENGAAVAINNPGRLVIIGGPVAAVERTIAAALALGAGHGGLLAVHVAAHTPRLAAAVGPFAAALHSVPSQRPCGRLVTASTAGLVGAPAAALNGLATQLAAPIDWAGVTEALIERGVTRIIDLGPGRALAEMMAGLLPPAMIRAAADFHSLDGLKAWISAPD